MKFAKPEIFAEPISGEGSVVFSKIQSPEMSCAAEHGLQIPGCSSVWGTPASLRGNASEVRFLHLGCTGARPRKLLRSLVGTRHAYGWNGMRL